MDCIEMKQGINAFSLSSVLYIKPNNRLHTKQRIHITPRLVHFLIVTYLCNIEASKNSVVSIQHQFQTIHIFYVLLLLVKYEITQLMINQQINL